jgi:hypothetical protein
MLLAESLLGSSSTAANYIEDVFSTYLYTGTAATQTITNGIDLSTNSGMVWLKSRSAVGDHYLFDTSRGTTKFLASNSTNQQLTGTTTLTAFNSNGFTLGSATATNGSGTTYASWTFRKQAKFFDVVTYTGNGANRTIAHNLGSVPGCIIVKCTSDVTDWAVYHRSLTSATNALQLNTTGAQLSNAAYWNSTAPTSTVFSVGTDNDTNGNLRTYVAYLFAHDAGGFGATGTDNVISCGSYTGNGGTQTVTLGYEPQWVLIKNSDGNASGTLNWNIIDNMRGMPVGSNDSVLYPNASDAEASSQRVAPTATGFTIGTASGNLNDNGAVYIYIAIRRGPMKTPTTGTSVFGPVASTGTSSARIISGTTPTDLVFIASRGGQSGLSPTWWDRLRGANNYLQSGATAAENNFSSEVSGFDVQSGFSLGTSNAGLANASGWNYVYECFRRAPGFFDVVCYTGTGASATLNHNLGVSPEMVIIKGRSVVSNWETYLSLLGGTGGNGLAINDSGAKSGTPPVSSVTATTFTLNNGVSTSNGQTYVAYLFATVAGVSTINCGFTGGARFVLIKRTDSTGNWTVFDSARGIVAGNDPALYLNSTAAEVTTIDAVDTASSGFIVNQDATLNLNVNNATYIGLAIA